MAKSSSSCSLLKKSDSTGLQVTSLGKAVLYGLLGQIAALTVPLIMMGPMWTYLGDDKFALWVTFVSATAILLFVDLGTGNAFTTKLSQAISQSDLLGARSLVAVALRINCVIFVVGITTAGLILVCLSWLSEDVSILLVGLPVFFFFFASFPAGLLYKILYAKRLILRCNLIQVLVLSASALISLGAIHFAAPVWLTISVLSGLPVLGALGVLSLELRADLGLPPFWRTFFSHETLGLFALGSRFLVLSILTSIGLNSDIVIISLVLGQEVVAASAIPIKMGTVLLSLIGFAFMPLWSIYAKFIAQNDFDLVSKFSIYSAIFGSLFILICGSALVYLADDIVRVWIGSVFPSQTSILSSMTVFAAVVALTSPFNMMLNAQGLVATQIYPWLMFVSVSLTAKFFFLSPDRVWLAPSISAITYAIFVTPFIINSALRSLRAR